LAGNGEKWFFSPETTKIKSSALEIEDTKTSAAREAHSAGRA